MKKSKHTDISIKFRLNLRMIKKLKDLFSDKSLFYGKNKKLCKATSFDIRSIFDNLELQTYD